MEKVMNDEERFYEFLFGVQLHQFYEKFVNELHVSRIDHLAHVSETELLSLNMTKPESRRLLEYFKSYQKRSIFKKLRRSFRISKKDEESNCKYITFPQNCPTNNKKQILKCLIKEEDIVFKDLIGKGAFGYVQSAVWSVEPNKLISVAVKCLQGSKESGIAAMQDELIQEANAMSNLTHPNLIRLFGVVLASPMCLVTELAPLGSLLRRLRNEPEKFLISTLSSFVVQIIAGMKYLEAHHFVHRDLAARNILLMTYEKIKIGDFGLARPLSSEVSYYVMQPDGQIPFAWCAPECLNFRRFSHASDLWSFGVTVYELFSMGAEPWAGLNGSEILSKIDEPNFERLKKPLNCPTAIYSIISNSCWKHIPEERGTFIKLEKEILNVLPYEVTAISARVTDIPQQLCYCQGDNITIFDANNKDLMWRGQNRRTGMVGFFPSEYANLKHNIISGVSEMFIVASSQHSKVERNISLREGKLKNRYTDRYFFQKANLKSTFTGFVAQTDDVSPNCNVSFHSIMENSINERESRCCSDLSSSAGSLSLDSGCYENVNGSDSPQYCLKNNCLYNHPKNGITLPINIPPNSQKSALSKKHRSSSYSIQNGINATGISSDPITEKEIQCYDASSSLIAASKSPTGCQSCDSGIFDSSHVCSETMSPQRSCFSPEISDSSSPNLITDKFKRQFSLPRCFENKLFGVEVIAKSKSNNLTTGIFSDRKSEFISSFSSSRVLNEKTVVYDLLPIANRIPPNTYDLVPKRDSNLEKNFEGIPCELTNNLSDINEKELEKQRSVNLYDTPKPRGFETDLGVIDKNAIPMRPPRLKTKNKHEKKTQKCAIVEGCAL